jgi:hypothetical protein
MDHVEQQLSDLRTARPLWLPKLMIVGDRRRLLAAHGCVLTSILGRTRTLTSAPDGHTIAVDHQLQTLPVRHHPFRRSVPQILDGGGMQLYFVPRSPSREDEPKADNGARAPMARGDTRRVSVWSPAVAGGALRSAQPGPTSAPSRAGCIRARVGAHEGPDRWRGRPRLPLGPQ